MKTKLIFLLLGLFLCSCADRKETDENLNRLLKGSVQALQTEKGDSNLCVLTNAAYVKQTGRETEMYLTAIREETGCSEQKGNLLFFQAEVNSPLIVAVFNKQTGGCIVMKPGIQEEQPLKLHIKKELVSQPDFWKNASGRYGESSLYSMVSILGAWSLGAPHDFLKSAEIHDHVCPGLAFGYFIAKTIQKKFPLRKGEEYVFVANNPDFCGNSAFRVVLGVTEEKKSLILKPFSSAAKKPWTMSRGAGVLVKWEKQTDTGRAVIIGIDMPAVREITGFERPSEEPDSSAAAVFKLIPYLTRFDRFVTVLWDSPVNRELMQELMDSENDPYEVIGLNERSAA